MPSTVRSREASSETSRNCAALPKVSPIFHKLIKGFNVAKHRSFRSALRHGVAASIEHDVVPLPSDIRTVLDIGANRGQFAIYACGRFPAATIHSFEPIPQARARLESIIPGGRDVRTYGVALASGAGEVEFNVTSDDDSSSLLAPSRVQMDAFPGSRPAEKITVSTARLDDTLARDQLIPPVLMKLDVQGGELDALMGATETLATTDFVLVECSFVELYEGQPLYDEVISFLTSQGFELAGFYSPTVENGRLLQADALLTRGRE